MSRQPSSTLISTYAPPDTLVDSSYGQITHSEWCQREIVRINRGSKQVRAHLVKRSFKGVTQLAISKHPETTRK